MTSGLIHVVVLYAVVVLAGLVLLFFTGEDRALPLSSRRRARKLFLTKLTPGQRRSWFFRRRFTTVGARGKRYTIGPYEPFNIRTKDGRFCVAVEGAIPVYDKLLAQKLLVEADESLFLSLANHRP